MTEHMLRKINTVKALLPKFEEIRDKAEDLVSDAECNEPDDSYVMIWERWNEGLENKQQRLAEAEELLDAAENFAYGEYGSEEELNAALEELVDSAADYCIDYGNIKHLVKKLCELIPGSTAAAMAKLRGACAK